MRAFWRSILRAAVTGALAGLFAVAFLAVEHVLIGLVWGHDLPTRFFAGGIRALLIPVAGGLIAGLLYVVFRLPTRLPGFIEELEHGRVEPKHAPGAVLVALASLVGGASLGPEAPLATGAGGAATWWRERQGADADTVRAANEAAVSGIFGGLLSSPSIGGLITLELEHDQHAGYTFRAIIPAIVAGVTGFIVVHPILGDVFLGRYVFEPFELEYWHFAAAVGIGIVGAGVAVLLGLISRLVDPIISPLDDKPVVRSVVGGVALGVMGFAVPLTMFSGIDQLEVVMAEAAALGAGLLLVIAFVKAVVLVVSLRSGFYGGPFFPVFFIGGTLGTALHLIAPSIPLALAVGGFMGASAGAAVSIPLSIIIFAMFIVGVGPPAAGVIVVATLTAFVLVRGVAMARRAVDEIPENGS
jgi:H+/Cl- antiporter ClcA